MRHPRIRKVTDMRTGLVHPYRDHAGRFVSRKTATAWIDARADLLANPTVPLDMLRYMVSDMNRRAER